MKPHLVKWHEQYHDRGLKIIEIDNGGIDDLAELQEHLAEEGIEFPVLHDTGGTICSLYGVTAYPTAYLVDRTGQVVWEGHPDGGPELEAKLEQALGSS